MCVCRLVSRLVPFNFSAPRVAADHMISLICALPLVPPSACFSPAPDVR